MIGLLRSPSDVFSLCENKKELRSCDRSSLGSRRLPIFPGRLQPSIVGVCELNFCVRNGNRWDLTA